MTIKRISFMVLGERYDYHLVNDHGVSEVPITKNSIKADIIRVKKDVICINIGERFYSFHNVGSYITEWR